MFEDITYFRVDRGYVDQCGHVDYKAVLPIIEKVLNDFLVSRGAWFPTIERDFGLQNFVQKLEVIWHDRLNADDIYLVKTRFELDDTSIKLSQEIEMWSPIVTILKTVVFVDNAGEPSTIPDQLRRRLSRKCEGVECNNAPAWLMHAHAEYTIDRRICEACANGDPSFDHRYSMTRSIWQDIRF